MAVSDLFLLFLNDTPAPAAAVVDAYIAQADALVMGYLATDTIPTGVNADNARAMLAVILYNRRGAEGEYKRAEGDVASWFETVPEIIKLQLRPYRAARSVTMLGGSA